MSQTLQKRLRLWTWGLLVAVVSSVGDAGAAFLVAPKLIEQHCANSGQCWPHDAQGSVSLREAISAARLRGTGRASARKRRGVIALSAAGTYPQPGTRQFHGCPSPSDPRLECLWCASRPSAFASSAFCCA